MEKPNALYNEQGQVNDPEIARRMAEREDELRGENGKKYRNQPFTQEEIDRATNDNGELEQKMKMRKFVVNKIRETIKETLSPEEIIVLEDIIYSHNDKDQLNFLLDLVRK